MADVGDSWKARGSMRLAKNSGWQLASYAARAASGLAVIFILARASGPHGLGIYQFALTFSQMVPFYWGLTTLTAREVARTPQDARRWSECGALVTLLIGAAVLALFAGGGRVIGVDPITLDAVVLAGIGLVLDAVSRVWFCVFWAWERMKLESICTAVQETTLVAGAAAIAVAGGGVRGMLWMYIASRGIGVAISWMVLTRRLGGPIIPRTSIAFAKKILRMATPFAANDTLTLIYGRADAVMLGMIKGPAAVGLYLAATNLVLNFNILARSVNHAIYPRMSRAWTQARERVGKLRDAALHGLALIAIPATVGSLLIAPEILRFLYGSKFDRAILAYRILALAIPVRMLGNTLSLTLSATDRQTRRTVGVLIAAIGNVGLNLYFIPRWSYLGAAMTTLITETALFIAYLAMVREVAGPSRLVRAIAGPTLACVPLTIVVLAMASAPMPAPVAGGALAYGVGLLAIAAVKAGRARRRDPRALITALVGSGS
jgi:O-antigen/teichoic acid export membrane protein